MSAPGWAAPALGALLDRVAVTQAEIGVRFPLFADPDSGVWTSSRRGSWTGGFWAGLLWLRARHTGDADDRAAAAACTARLAGWVEADTAARGLILWYGTVLADDPATAALRGRAARACLQAYDPELGLVPWGSAFGGPRLVARPDAVPGLVLLLATVNAKAAESHLRTHLDLWQRHGAARFEPGTGWLPCPEPTRGWSRGRAWLMLAAADAVAHLARPDLVGVAGKLATAPLVAYADENRPAAPVDTSAAAISAVALLKLGQYDRATAVLEELVAVHLTDDGRLLNGCYDLGGGTATRHELVWGSFFLAYGLAALTGLVDVHGA